jgi:phage protein D
MASTFQLLMDGTAADEALYDALALVEVEENVDLPGAIELSLPVDRSEDGDLSFVSDKRFKPFANLALVAQLEDGQPECLFDGYVLSHKVHLETGITSSTLKVWGQDAEWLMNLEEKAREWADLTDADVASSIFGEYGITPASANSDDDSPAHTEAGHTLMQRASDIQFLRRLARSNGKVCRVACAGRPGDRTGYFAKPDLGGEPTATLSLNDPEVWSVDALDIDWDVTHPTAVKARQALFTDDAEDGVGSEPTDSGLTLLDARGAADFAGRAMTVLLAAPVDDAGELSLRATAVLRDAGWFVRCEGEADVARVKAILRAGTVVQLDGLGSLHSGKYFVWSVRHRIDSEAHKMRFVLVRNAVGPDPAGGAAGLLGGLF